MPLSWKGSSDVLDVLKLTRRQWLPTMKDEEKEIPKLLSKFKKKAFLLGLYILVTSQSMTDAALT